MTASYFRARSIAMVATALLIIWLSGCSETQRGDQVEARQAVLDTSPAVSLDTSLTSEQTTDAEYSSGGGPETGCQASSSWISSPSLPADIPSPQNNCSFQQYIWQTFLYLVQPSAESNSPLNFETWMPNYGIFVGKGEKPVAWGEMADVDFCSGEAAKVGEVYSNLTLQAGSHFPLIDLQLEDVYYGVAVNKPAYDFIEQCDLYKSHCALTLAPDLLSSTDEGIDIPNKYPNLAFPDQAIELKTSWKVLTQAEVDSGLFYTAPGHVKSPAAADCNSVTLGLVGMHIVSKPPSHPEFIWATLEHRNNAPDCSDLSATPPLGSGTDWTFYDASSAADTNSYQAGNAIQVCRMHPMGDPTQGIFPDGLDCDLSPAPAYICNSDVQKYVIDPNNKAISSINKSAQDLIAQEAKADQINAVWANYELVGNLWTKNGVLPPNLQVQEGSLSAANTTMETYVQNGESTKTNPNSCFSCHNLEGKLVTKDGVPVRSTLPPAGLSHIFNLLQLDTGGCESGDLPAACAAYH